MRLRSKLASLALTCLLSAGTAVATSSPAHADCRRVVGQVLWLYSPAGGGWGGHIADFYQGYDQCAHRTYAEIHFWNTVVPGSASGVNNVIAIENAEWTQFGWATDGIGRWNTNPPWQNNPGYPSWWDAGPISIYGLPSEIFKASFDFTYNAPDGSHHCYGESWWNYNNGSVPVQPVSNCDY